MWCGESAKLPTSNVITSVNPPPRRSANHNLIGFIWTAQRSCAENVLSCHFVSLEAGSVRGGNPTSDLISKPRPFPETVLGKRECNSPVNSMR